MALVFADRNRLIPLFALAAALILLLAGGTFVYQLAAGLLPALDQTAPLRALYVFGFCLTVLAALGLDQLLAQIGSRRRAAGATAMVVGLALTGSLWAALAATSAGREWFFGASNASVWLNYARAEGGRLWSPLALGWVTAGLVSALAWLKAEPNRRRIGWLLAGLASAELLLFAMNFNTVSPRTSEYPATPGVQALQARLRQSAQPARVAVLGKFLANSLTVFGLEEAGGYYSLFPRRTAEFFHLLNQGPTVPRPGWFWNVMGVRRLDSPLLDLLNVEYLLAPPGVRLPPDRFDLVYAGEVALFRNLRAMPRAFWVPGWRLVDQPNAAYSLLGRMSREQLADWAVLETSTPELAALTPSSVPARSSAEIKLVSYTGNRIEFAVHTKQAGLLLVSENYHPDWKAWVDGQACQILRADYVFRALPLKAGSHTVVMSYQPRLLQLALLMTLLGWLGLLTGILFCRIYKKKTFDIILT